MYPDPEVHRLLAADRADRLHAAYAARRRTPRRSSLRRAVGLRLVALGLRVAGPQPGPAAPAAA